MRLGGPLYLAFSSPEEWARLHREAGYSAVYCPIDPQSPAARDASVVTAHIEAARVENLVIAEVGAWSNPIDPDPAKAAAALEKCRAALDLADRVGARCCVNITGSRDPEKWDGPHPENFSQETFDMIVDSTRAIIDAVNPARTCYTLEAMPWIFPSSPDEYLALLKAIDRPGQIGVHLDPVNMINSPMRMYKNADLLRECFAKLGPYIRSCHAKDLRFGGGCSVRLEECRPGTGGVDYAVFLRELSRLEPDTPLCMEHLPGEEYPAAAEHIRAVARENGLAFV
jgi:Sugar phosphate isomerases/epimerases